MKIRKLADWKGFVFTNPLLPTLPGAFFAVCLSFVFFIFLNVFWRTVFLFYQSNALDFQQGWLLVKAVFIGLRLDGVISGYITLPVLLTAFLPYIGWKTLTYKRLYTAYNIISLFLISLLHLFDLQFFKEFGMHINYLLLNQAGNKTELWSYLTTEYPILQYLVVLAVVISITGWIFHRLTSFLRKIKTASPILHLTTFIILTAGLGLACRGGWQERPIDWGFAIFSDNTLANQTALNGIFFLGRSIVELSSDDRLTEILSVYPPEEAKRVTSEILSNNDGTQVDTALQPQPASYNVMIVILESFTGALCGYLNPELQVDITPYFDEMAGNGVSFSRCYANGNRSAHGISTIMTGRPTLPGLPLIYKVESMSGIPTIGSILQARGYTTTYYYGGDANYDNMSGFLKINGFQHIRDQHQLPSDAEGTSWGRFDHYLFQMALEDMNRTTPPFLSVMFTTTNHQPWKIPGSYESDIPHFPNAPYHRRKTARSMAYVDRVIHDFLDKAASRPWFSNTIFIFTADHGLWVDRDDFDDPINAKIPLIIYNPILFPQGKTIDTITSQADILPVVLSLLNIDDSNISLWGKNPLKTSVGFACRVINDQIYWFENDFMYKEILQQNKKLYRILIDGSRVIEYNEYLQNTMEKRCKSYLQTAYFSLKEKNSISQSGKQQHNINVVNLGHISDKQ